MIQPTTTIDVAQLTVQERLDLIAKLWDSIPDTLEALPIPESHWREIERRLDDADANPDASIPWDEARARLRRKP